MGQLKPGATYVYESPDGGESVYAREVGTSERVLVGQSYKSQSLHDQIVEDKIWGDIRHKAKTHPGLAAELERVKVYYHLINDDSKKIMWHPV